MLYCPYCGTRVGSGERFCSSCGKALVEEGTATGKGESTRRFPWWVLALLFGSAAVLVLVLIFVHQAKRAAEIRGNSTGNISNFGLLASQGDWIYHLYQEDEGETVGLYKTHADGSGRTRISEDTAMFLNVAGDWIYYVMRDEESDSYRNEIYK
ncbi:MAG: DUF5050 domain-containing protein, partial [Firmicutes bacterium]|nr:DUF5050 domain-containing protein [Bacillota bacterium]